MFKESHSTNCAWILGTGEPQTCIHTSDTSGCGSKYGTQNGTLVHGNKDQQQLHKLEPQSHIFFLLRPGLRTKSASRTSPIQPRSPASSAPSPAVPSLWSALLLSRRRNGHGTWDMNSEPLVAQRTFPVVPTRLGVCKAIRSKLLPLAEPCQQYV